MRHIQYLKLLLTAVTAISVLASVTARAATYTLTVLANGSGTVSRNPTNSVYPAGSVVTVTALPNTGWLFSSWTGDEIGTVNPLNVTLTSNKVITANFQLTPSYVLTTSTEGMGSISLAPAGSSYLSNSVVSATATAAMGWLFLNWTGDASGTTNPLAIVMDRNKALTANFAQPATIDGGPQNVSTDVGATASFSVHAVGTPVLFYQWWFNNLRLENATNATLTLTSIQAVQEGTYSVTVSNAYGVSSNSALLTIADACSGTNVVSMPTEAGLRGAIAAGGVVRLCFNGTITLTNTIDITNDVVLDANNRAVVISGNNAVRLFNVGPGVKFSATNLVFANGSYIGPNGANAGAQPAGPGLPGEGGAILNNGGTVQLSGCTFVSNSVTGGMGGAGNHSYPNAPNPDNGLAGEGRGGAILVRGGSLLLDSVNLSANAAIGGPVVFNSGPVDAAGNGLGGAIYITNGTVVMVNCNLSSNSCMAPGGGSGAAARGGAVFLASGSVTFSNSLVGANMAVGGNSPGFGGAATPSAAYGGGIGASSGTVTLLQCQISSNTALGGNAFRHSGTGEAQGGGVFSTATVLVWDSSFYGNDALSGNGSDLNTDGRGGAFYNLGTAIINRSAFISNLANGGNAGQFGGIGVNYPGGYGLGGGIFNESQLTLTNSTIALNSAIGGNGGNPAGIPGSGLGGGIYNSNGTFVAVNVTIASNSVVAGQGFTYQGVAGGAEVANSSGSLSLLNSIIAYPGGSSNAWGTITDAGFNMSSDGSANFSSGSSFNFTDPLLRAVGDHGGPTLTMALQADSPAADLGTSVGAPPTDQRSLPRPAGSGVDLGAYELQAGTTKIPVLAFAFEQGALLLSFQAQTNVTYSLRRSVTLTDWTEIELIGPFVNVTNVNRSISVNGQSPVFFRLFIPY